MTHNNSAGLTQPKERPISAENLDNKQSRVRYHYLDNLRALAMFVGVIFHAALAYSPLLQNLWFTSGTDTSPVIDYFSFFTHLFRMPVFFLISGFFAIMMIQKKGLGGFLKNRVLRILLPFIIFFPLLAIVIMSAIGWALDNVESLSPMLQFVKVMSNNPDAPPPPLTTMHLWFLFNLFLFVLVTALLFKLNFFKSKIFENLSSIKFFLIVLPLLMVPAMISQSVPHPAPEKFYPELWSFGFYGLFFILGCMIFLKQSLLDELSAYKNFLLIISILAYSLFYYALPTTISFEAIIASAGGIELSWAQFMMAVLESYIAVFMTLYCLIIGKQLLDRQNKVLRLISDSSYWVYLIHLPILLMIQFYLADVEVGMWIKFVISTIVTFIIGLLSYIFLVKQTPVGWLLNGRKNK
jgi:peptidoglycan/LPS O-acetylase OafA/YrhL